MFPTSGIISRLIAVIVTRSGDEQRIPDPVIATWWFVIANAGKLA
jgi:hypothetical protein